jgi:hypothetical protein
VTRTPLAATFDYLPNWYWAEGARIEESKYKRLRIKFLEERRRIKIGNRRMGEF